MGFDQVTWAPVIGGSGDNLYNVPGATKLDNTLDTTGGPCGVDVGDASGFSTPPTIAQINASSGINQVIGLYNRRAGQYNTLFGTSLTIMSYLSASVRPKAADFTNLFNNVGTLRTQEGWTAALAWPNTTPTAGRPIRGYHLAYLRKSLAISGTISIGHLSPTNFIQYTYTRVDNPYPTAFSESFATSPSAASSFGKLTNTAPKSNRRRQIFRLAIPDWVTTPATQQVQVNFSGSNSALESFTPTLYSFNTDTGVPSLGTGFNGTFYTPDNLEGTFPFNTGILNSLNVGLTPILNNVGAYYAILLVDDKEYAGTGLDPATGGLNSFLLTGNLVQLVMTF